jgi:hypothetical protein
MSKNTAHVNVNIESTNFQVSTPETGIAYLLGPTRFGKVNNPEDLIASWKNFEDLFGGDYSIENLFPLNVKHILNAGGKIRICRVLGAGSAASVGEEVYSNEEEEPSPNPLFRFDAKNNGAYYDNVTVVIAAASNADPDYFDVRVYVSGVLKETYKNLTIPADVTNTAGPYEYLDDITNNSNWVVPYYGDLTDIGDISLGQLTPTTGTYTLSGGSDGAAIDSDDYGDALVAFDGYDDGWIIAVPHENDTSLAGLNGIMKAYVENRQDMVYLEHLDNDEDSASDIVAYIAGVANNSNYCGFIGGGIKAVRNAAILETQGLGDVIGTILRSHQKNGVWISPTGYLNGLLVNAVGIVNDFGSPAKGTDLNTVCNAGANMLLTRNNKRMLWDFYSMGDEDLPERFLSIVFLEIYLVKVLKPYLEKYLGRPNTFSTWVDIYYAVKPFLDNLIAEQALFSYEWQGDQFVSDLDNLQVNSKADVLAGIYTVILSAVVVAPMVEINLTITINENDNTVSIA